MTKQCAYCEDNLITENTREFLDENLCDICCEDESLSAEQRRWGMWEDYVEDQRTGN